MDATQKTPDELKQDVIAMLKTCYDPEIPVDIYELGLIYDVAVNADRHVTIRMTLTSPMCPVAESLPPEEPRGYPLPRLDSHAWFLVTGEHAPAMFAKICGVDLRPEKFDDLAIAQTSIARITAIAIRDDRGGYPAYHLLCDSASANYFWDCLLDAMAEFDGRPVGLAALA